MKLTHPFRADPSATGSFSALKSILPSIDFTRFDKTYKAVVIGGGTGAPMSIRTLLSLGIQTNAVVAMADDGGSTGILREEADVTPPGDIRKCIAAFAADPKDPLVKVFKYRFAVARDHALGNLLLVGLEDACGSFPEAISICERLLNARGHVYPSTLDHVRLVARTRDGHTLDGQAVASHSRTALERVELRSDHGEITAYEPALEAIRQADLIVLGPGSLFTSIIPNLLVPGVIDAIRASRGLVLFVCSLADQQGETWGLTAREHFEALADHGMHGLVDYMLIHAKDQPKPDNPVDDRFRSMVGEEVVDVAKSVERDHIGAGVRPVAISYSDMMAIQAEGPVVVMRDLADSDHPTWHNPEALARAFLDVMKMMRSRKGAAAR